MTRLGSPTARMIRENDPPMAAIGKYARGDLIGTILCLFVGFVLRLAIILNQPTQLTEDRDVYLGIATNLAEGRGYSVPNSTSPTAFRPPLYPLGLAAGMMWFSPAIVVAGINLLTGICTIWLTIGLGERLQLGSLRFVAAMLTAVDPLLVFYTAQPMTESLCTCLATLWLCSMIGLESMMGFARQEHPQRSVDSLCTGIVFGLLVLCRPAFWLIPLVWGFGELLAIAIRERKSPIRRWRPSPSVFATWASAGIGAMLVVLPWLIRNGIVFGVPILTTTHGGYTLLLGNNPVFYQEVVMQPWGTVWERESLLTWLRELESQIVRDLGPQASEFRRDQWHSQQAKKAISANPSLFIAAVGHRIRSLWNTVPQGDAANSTRGWGLQAVGLFYTAVLLAGGLGLILALRREDCRQWLPLYVLIASVQLAHLVYWTNTRMRSPLTPAIALLAVSVIPRRLSLTPRQ